jgi:hypothetical protein
MTKRTFRPQKAEKYDTPYSEQLLTQEPVAVYYRQSTTAQVGNISTTIQTVDMVDELVRRGWQRDKIILIDDDEGVSGTKRIDEREGMSYLFELIADHKIGAVACQDEDRLFRDMTQIQVNIFIDTCRKSKVKVITPYFTYDFAHPLQGEFHARQFRFKCDMAAEYLKSYVLGRLAPARQRLLRDGKWAGAKMPVGYMVDMRKHLPDGTENPNWRKFIPFEPYAEIVREYFRVFLECGGAIRKAMRQIRDQHIGFPDCKPPEGFKISYQLKQRGDGRYPNRGNFIYLLTNPVYIGHWCYKGVVHCWNNHTPLIDTDVFMRVFNLLSRYTLTGEENPNYQPAYQYVRPQLDEERPVDRPLLAGLIHSEVNGRWYRAGVMFEKRNQCYLYVLHKVEFDGTVLEWARRGTWLDETVVNRLRQKLQETFNSDQWMNTIRDQEQLVERQRKIKRLEYTTVTEQMQNLVESLKTLSLPHLVQEVEERYTQLEREQKRLEAEIANFDLKRQWKVSLEQAYSLFKRVVDDWDKMSQDERRNVLGLFIDRIEASDYTRAGDMKLTVWWKDGKKEEIQLWRKSHTRHWSVDNVQKLLALFDKGATQLEIAAAYPDLKWYQIFNEIRKHRGLIRFTPIWLGKSETYQDYLSNSGRKSKATPSLWRDEELATLRAMVERQATQLEIMQEFPYRRWIQVKCRIKEMFGKGVRVPLSGISQRLTYIEYAQEQKTVNADLSSETVSHYF